MKKQIFANDKMINNQLNTLYYLRKQVVYEEKALKPLMTLQGAGTKRYEMPTISIINERQFAKKTTAMKSKAVKNDL